MRPTSKRIGRPQAWVKKRARTPDSWTKSGINTKLYAVTNAIERPICLFITAGQVGDYNGAKALVSSLHAADCLRQSRTLRRLVPRGPRRQENNALYSGTQAGRKTRLQKRGDLPVSWFAQQSPSNWKTRVARATPIIVILSMAAASFCDGFNAYHRGILRCRKRIPKAINKLMTSVET